MPSTTQALPDSDDPRINFAVLGSDASLAGEASCHESSDVMNTYTGCYRHPQTASYLKGNFTMFTGKGDISKVRPRLYTGKA